MIRNNLTPAKKIPLTQNVTQQLIDLIMAGNIAPGEKLPTEKELMDIFGIGRSSLREAIRALVALGLVEVKVSQGTFVSECFGDFFTKQLALMSKISFENIIELIEARIAIETDIAEMAAKKATSDDVKNLVNICRGMKAAQSDEEYQNCDLKFHIALAEISRNSFMLQVMKILNNITGLWIRKVIQVGDSKKQAILQHERIIDAIHDKNVSETVIAMREHLESVSKTLLEIQKSEEILLSQ